MAADTLEEQFSYARALAKTEFAEEGTFCEFLLIKKLDIEKTKTTFIVLVLKVVYIRD